MKIKRITALLLVCAFAVLSLLSCNGDTQQTDESQTIYHTATFNFSNGDAPYSVSVADGELVSPPIPPERENYIFNGWKKNGTAWDFSSSGVFADVDFVAQWIDASTLFGYSANGDGTITVTEYKGALDEIRIPEIISGMKVTALGEKVFIGFADNNSTLISLPETLTSIGNSAFEGCSELKISVLGKISSLGERAFDGCVLLSDVSLDDSLESIPFRAFAGCTSLKSFYVPKNVKTIGEDAFDGCSSVQTLIIASKDVVIEDSAFSDCDALVTVFFEGDESEWQSILANVDNGGDGNSDLLDAKVYFFSETEKEGDFWYYNEKGEPRCW